jgi:hypothetical protein
MIFLDRINKINRISKAGGILDRRNRRSMRKSAGDLPQP